MSPFRKRPRRRTVGWFVLAVAVALPLGTDLSSAAPPEAAEIEHLIRQLGSPKFLEREAAAKALDAVGEPALPALEKAITATNDAEVRRRAQQLRAAICGRRWGEVRRLEGRGGP